MVGGLDIGIKEMTRARCAALLPRTGPYHGDLVRHIDDKASFDARCRRRARSTDCAIDYARARRLSRTWIGPRVCIVGMLAFLSPGATDRWFRCAVHGFPAPKWTHW